MVLELSWGDVVGVECVDIVISPVLGLGLDEEESNQDQDLGTSKEEHDSSTPVELIGVDEVGEDGRKHEGGELLADESKGNGLGSSDLRGSLLSDSPSEATYGCSVQHGPGDHEGEERGASGLVGVADD